jgi:hypothetical protein
MSISHGETPPISPEMKKGTDTECFLFQLFMQVTRGLRMRLHVPLRQENGRVTCFGSGRLLRLVYVRVFKTCSHLVICP